MKVEGAALFQAASDLTEEELEAPCIRSDAGCFS